MTLSWNPGASLNQLALPRALSRLQGEPGCVVIWSPSEESLLHALQAPLLDVPPSHQQEQHVRNYLAHDRQKIEVERLLIFQWDVPGVCQIPLLTETLNTHLRRHDAYHSWFSLDDDGNLFRRVLENPQQLSLIPATQGLMTVAELTASFATTPPPLQWDCFRFAIIQREDHFSFFACIDHLYTDAFLMPILVEEIYACYQKRLVGLEPKYAATSSYLAYCQQQRMFTDQICNSHPLVEQWLHCLRSAGGCLPRFPLSIGDCTRPVLSTLRSLVILDAPQSVHFAQACRDAGITIFAALMGCLAVTIHRLTDTEHVSFISPVTTRQHRSELHTMGWYTGVVPYHAQIDSVSLPAVAQAIQSSFRSNRHLAHLPIEVLHSLTDGDEAIRWPEHGGCMVSYMDTNHLPLRGGFARDHLEHNGGVYMNSGASRNVAMWFTRSPTGLTLSISHRDTEEANVSVQLWTEELIHTCLEFIATSSADSPLSSHLCT